MRILSQVDPEILLKLGLSTEVQRGEERNSEVDLKWKSSKSSLPEIKLCPSYDEGFE